MPLEKRVFAVADGTVVSVQHGKPEMTPNILMKPETPDDYGGNQVILEIAPNVFALYLHLHPGSLTVKIGDVVKVGAPLAKIGNTRPLDGPSPSFWYFQQARPFYGAEPAFCLRQLYPCRHYRFRRLKGGSPGDLAGFAAGAGRLSALRQHPKLPVAISDHT